MLHPLLRLLLLQEPQLVRGSFALASRLLELSIQLALDLLDLGGRLVAAGDENFLSRLGARDEVRKLRLGVMHVDRSHAGM